MALASQKVFERFLVVAQARLDAMMGTVPNGAIPVVPKAHAPASGCGAKAACCSAACEAITAD